MLESCFYHYYYFYYYYFPKSSHKSPAVSQSKDRENICSAIETSPCLKISEVWCLARDKSSGRDVLGPLLTFEKFCVAGQSYKLLKNLYHTYLHLQNLLAVQGCHPCSPSLQGSAGSLGCFAPDYWNTALLRVKHHSHGLVQRPGVRVILRVLFSQHTQALLWRQLLVHVPIFSFFMGSPSHLTCKEEL